MNHITKLVSVLAFILMTVSLFAQIKPQKKATLQAPKQMKAISPKSSDDCCKVEFPVTAAEVTPADLFEKQFKITTFSNSNGVYQYKLTHTPTSNFKTVLQAYLDYVKVLYPCATKLGMRFKIGKDNFGPGHTTKLVTPGAYTGFTPNGGGVYTYNPTDTWDRYYTNPTQKWPNDASGKPLVATNGLFFNEIYHIEMGAWIDGCQLSQKEKDCLWAHITVNFRIQFSEGPLRSSGSGKLTLEILNENGSVIDKKIIKQ